MSRTWGRIIIAAVLAWLSVAGAVMILFRATLADINMHHHHAHAAMNHGKTRAVRAPPVLNQADPMFTSHTVASLLEDVHGSDAHRYNIKDSRGEGMDCARVVFAPIDGEPRIRRYLAVYHTRSRVTRQFEVHLAQSFDLMRWEHLRRVAVNADMPAIRVDNRTGRVLVVYEQFLSSTGQSPCALGIRQFASTQHLVSGLNDATAQFRIPNSISKIEGTPSIDRWDPSNRNVCIWFHFHNDTNMRDMVARGTLTGFPGATPSWVAEPHHAYNHRAMAVGVSGNIGGRHRLAVNDVGTHDGGSAPTTTSIILQEGNVQLPPLLPTDWASWRVWLYRDGLNHTLTMLNVQTHSKSLSIANPWADVLECPFRNCSAESREGSAGMCLVVGYFIFGEGAAHGEAGQLLFYKRIARPPSRE